MEIRFVWKGRYYVVSIGHETSWFRQIPFIVVSEEFYEDKNRWGKVTYARMIFSI